MPEPFSLSRRAYYTVAVFSYQPTGGAMVCQGRISRGTAGAGGRAGVMVEAILTYYPSRRIYGLLYGATPPDAVLVGRCAALAYRMPVRDAAACSPFNARRAVTFTGSQHRRRDFGARLPRLGREAY